MFKTLSQSPLNKAAIFVVVCLIGAIVLSVVLLSSRFTVPEPLTIILGVASLLLVWHFSFQFPYLGMVSMERLPQFHMLLTLSISDTLIINAIAALMMPFLNKKYRMDSYSIAFLRAGNNIAMNIFLILSGYLIIEYFLELPITSLSVKTVFVLLFAAIVTQIVNVIHMVGFINFYNKKGYKLVMTPKMMFMDLVFVPVGVLSALLYQLDDKSIFGLFCFFVVLVLFSFNSFMPDKSSDSNEFKRTSTDYKSDSLDVKSICKAINRRAEQLFDMNCLYIFLKNHGSGEYELFHEQGVINSGEDRQKMFQIINNSNGIEVDRMPIVFKGNQTMFNIMSAPFKNQEGVFAYLILCRDDKRKFLQPDISLCKLLTNRYELTLSYAIGYKELTQYKEKLEQKVIERTMQLEQANHEKSILVEKLEDLSNRDGLTGCYNRRFFDLKMSELESGPPNSLGLAILDIDFFKQINDEFGHEVGDSVLKMVAELVKENCQHDLMFFRYGGEEFVILFVNPDIDTIHITCQEVVGGFSSFDWQIIHRNLNVTVSIGLAVYPQTEWNQLFTKADSRLYQAKKNGRNQLQF